MDGLQRMDNPRRWPWVAAVAIVVITAGFAWWHFRYQALLTPGLNNPPVSSSGGASSCEPAVLSNGVAELRPPEEKISSNAVIPVASGTIPVRVEGVPPVAELAATNVPAPSSSAATPLAAEADALLAADKKDKAREKYLAALEANPGDSLRSEIEGKLGPLNVELIRHPWPMAEKQEILVQPGDSIKAIARKSGTTVELIVKGNDLKRPDVIRPAQRLKVFSGKMEITVSKSRNDLLLTANGRFFKRYRVGTGRYEKTPVGTFTVVERIPEPPWWREDGKIVPFGDKENILGTRWMAIKATGKTPEIKGYGIHGTWDTNSIGKAESAGCIRLKNEDVEELFELIPVGTPVVIEE